MDGNDNEPQRSGVPRQFFIAATLWLAGAVIALLPLIVGAFRCFTLRRQARPINNPIWRDLLEEALRAAGAFPGESNCWRPKPRRCR